MTQFSQLQIQERIYNSFKVFAANFISTVFSLGLFLTFVLATGNFVALYISNIRVEARNCEYYLVGCYILMLL